MDEGKAAVQVVRPTVLLLTDSFGEIRFMIGDITEIQDINGG